MTTPKPPAAPTIDRRPPVGTRPDTAADTLSGMPPLPKTKPARAKAAQKPTADPTPGTGPAPEDGLAAITKKELFIRVKARADGVKGREVRQVMDAVLNELGAALVAGEALKVPALGTLKVQRRKSLAKADVVVCKLRRKKPGARAKDPLAKPAEES